MHLHRVTPDPFENYPVGGKFLGEVSDNYRADTLKFDGEPALPVVVTRFDRFGSGKHRKSDYEVISEWKDVEEIIAKFCEAKHPEAIALQKARQLAATIKNVGWREPGAK